MIKKKMWVLVWAWTQVGIGLGRAACMDVGGVGAGAGVGVRGGVKKACAWMLHGMQGHSETESAPAETCKGPIGNQLRHHSETTLHTFRTHTALRNNITFNPKPSRAPFRNAETTSRSV